MILKIKNEQGETLKSLLIEPKQLIAFGKVLNSEDSDIILKIPLICHIDPYSDTYINSFQSEMYIKEFETLRDTTGDLALKHYCTIVLTELRNLQQGTFLVFFGD